MSKYIIKNCPAILRMTKVCDAYETTRDLPQFCKDCTDCVIKQVIEKCKAKELDIFNPSIGNEHYAMANSVLSTQILQLFDIEEINK